ncbi:hypothetical protein AWB74_07882 [Caballeronia arvi]|uniref:Uncharacterized protein n=1 Tax=Caballeronia arvi TaxID=1777135 RepID=A0A158L2L4_9BURK|nr:hypothetical protein AWB74_07882 [Caballeronia arvi]
MGWLWTRTGISFGYRVDDQLRTHDGRHVGRFIGEEIFGADGLYLGEIASEDRLITRQRNIGRFKLPFRPRMERTARLEHLARAARLNAANPMMRSKLHANTRVYLSSTPPCVCGFDGTAGIAETYLHYGRGFREASRRSVRGGVQKGGPARLTDRSGWVKQPATATPSIVALRRRAGAGAAQK